MTDSIKKQYIPDETEEFVNNLVKQSIEWYKCDEYTLWAHNWIGEVRQTLFSDGDAVLNALITNLKTILENNISDAHEIRGLYIATVVNDAAFLFTFMFYIDAIIEKKPKLAPIPIYDLPQEQGGKDVLNILNYLYAVTFTRAKRAAVMLLIYHSEFVDFVEKFYSGRYKEVLLDELKQYAKIVFDRSCEYAFELMNRENNNEAI